MGYKPLQIKNAAPRSTKNTSLTAGKGINIKDLPQLLNTDFAQVIQNYIIVGDGQLQKRKGLLETFDVGAARPITMLAKGTDDIIVFAFTTTVAAYTISTDTITNIKTGFSINNGFEGARYGDFFFMANGVDRVWRFDLTNLGAGATELTETPTGSQVVRAIGARLFVGEGSSVHYSSIDDGTDPPFTNFTPVDTLADGPGRIDNRQGGTVRAIEPFGQDIIVFQDDGKFAFFINQIDSAGTLSRVDVFRMSRFDFGGARGAKMTSAGMFYFNEAGLWQLVSVGNVQLPLSDQEGLVSVFLGNNFFDDVTFNNADIIEDSLQKLILITAAKNSDTNNLVLAYHIDRKAFTQFIGWNINRFMRDQEDLYGGSALTNTVFQLFQGFDDNGADIGTIYSQEIKLGDFETRQVIKDFYVQGLLSPSTEITIAFNIFDVEGIPRINKKRYTWSTQYNLNGGTGWGTSTWGGSAWAGDQDFANLIESFDGAKIFIRNFQRLTVEFRGGDQLGHVLNWFSAESEVKAKIRRRQLVELT